MAIELREVSSAPLTNISASAPDGAVIGLIGENGSGKEALLQVIAGTEKPASGEVQVDDPRRLLGPGDKLNFAPVKTLLMDNTLSQHDALVRGRAMVGLERMRRSGSTVVIASHELPVLRSICDEVWWLHEGRLAAKGDPKEVIGRYERHIAQKLKAWGETLSPTLAPTLRRGDGRAQIVSLATINEQGQAAMVLQSGSPVGVKVVVRYDEPVDNPVVGIMIRTRIGFEVYGTNTDLEGVKLGPVAAGETVTLTFSFACDLCPQEYTLTVASHDPDGVWHDWLEDAIAFSVADSRYTAGVANLRAKVTVEKSS